MVLVPAFAGEHQVNVVARRSAATTKRRRGAVDITPRNDIPWKETFDRERLFLYNRDLLEPCHTLSPEEP